MITFANPATSSVVSFDCLLEKMKPHFHFFITKSLRHKADSDNYDEAFQELTTQAWNIYRGLVAKGKDVFFTPLMTFAMKRYKIGRYFMGENTTDLLADQTRILGRSEVCSLNKFDFADEGLHFMIDQKMNPSRQVQFQIDFCEDWFQSQKPRDREIIRALAMGESPGDLAKKYRLTPSAISQCKKRFAKSWYEFIADKEETDLIDELKELAEKQAA